ncbi:DUF3617 domain-containing protein [Altericroceibacterium spongiae]|uniref:DUF3617 domain-containing protein n=1 Tax=Altericroceibacterium spongiae TaxID=2320269 RepID=A0A420EM54_9SPHN|nr:DUF3617 domain-containing protein [Altericroceibacterium spongiae]RKF21795.1 DUF3617 domain-containing protein [Altericroceibacterium spongiae]
MRLVHCFPLVAAMALAACGGNGAKEEGTDESAPLSQEEVASKANGMIRQTPGQYQTSVELLDFDIPGLSEERAGQLKDMFAKSVADGNTYCLTQEDADKGPEAMLQQLAEADCTFKSLDVNGAKVDADMTCKGAGGADGNFKLNGTMEKESSEMLMEINQSIPNLPGEGKAVMKMKMNSKRVGECS